MVVTVDSTILQDGTYTLDGEVDGTVNASNSPGVLPDLPDNTPAWHASQSLNGILQVQDARDNNAVTLLADHLALEATAYNLQLNATTPVSTGVLGGHDVAKENETIEKAAGILADAQFKGGDIRIGVDDDSNGSIDRYRVFRMDQEPEFDQQGKVTKLYIKEFDSQPVAVASPAIPASSGASGNPAVGAIPSTPAPAGVVGSNGAVSSSPPAVTGATPATASSPVPPPVPPLPTGSTPPAGSSQGQGTQEFDKEWIDVSHYDGEGQRIAAYNAIKATLEKCKTRESDLILKQQVNATQRQQADLDPTRSLQLYKESKEFERQIQQARADGIQAYAELYVHRNDPKEVEKLTAELPADKRFIKNDQDIKNDRTADKKDAKKKREDAAAEALEPWTNFSGVFKEGQNIASFVMEIDKRIDDKDTAAAEKRQAQVDLMYKVAGEMRTAHDNKLGKIFDLFAKMISEAQQRTARRGEALQQKRLENENAGTAPTQGSMFASKASLEAQLPDKRSDAEKRRAELQAKEGMA